MNAVITSRYSAMRFYQWGPGKSEHADYSTTKTIPSHLKTVSTSIPDSARTEHTSDSKGCICFDSPSGAGTPLTTCQQDQMEEHKDI